MGLVELWVLLKTRYEEHHYNGQQLTQLHRQFPQVTPDVNEVAIITGIISAYSGSKLTKNQAEALGIEYRTNLTNALKEAGKDPAAMHIHNN